MAPSSSQQPPPRLHPATGSAAAAEDRLAPEPLSAERLAAAKIAFTCRRVPESDMQSLVRSAAPRAGDLVLARVERKRQHPRIELRSGRKALLFTGDEIVLAYGNRYASDQFEALVPPDLRPCGMVASGGVAAEVTERRRGVKPATEIRPLGLIADGGGEPLNLAGYALSPAPAPLHRPPAIGVVGSAMNAGKTTSAAQLVHGLRNAGLRVGAAKVTGTGSGGDYWKLLDAGAHCVLDFTDAGLASTYRVALPELLRIAGRLADELAHQGAEVIVLEVADGLYQQETAGLLESTAFRRLVDGFLLAVTDPLAAVAGSEWLERRELPLLALCGTLTSSPLAVREATAATALPVLSLGELADAEVARTLGDLAAGVPAAGRLVAGEAR